MQRVVVVGTTGSGKSTLAARVAQALNCPFVEPDALFWGPEWTPAPRDEFRSKVAAAVAADSWAIGGNYSVARDLIWPRADTLVWLDYPLPFVLWRLTRRTLRRVITQEALWDGNTETWRGQFASRDSLFLHAVNRHGRYRQEFPALLRKPEHAHLHVHRFRTPHATERWVKAVEEFVRGGGNGEST